MLSADSQLKDVTIRIRGITVTLHRQWRSEAAIRGMTMNEAVIEALALWVTTPRPKGAAIAESA